MKDYPINNLLREPTEIWSALTCFTLALLAYKQPHIFLLTEHMAMYAAVTLLIPGLYRAWEAIKVKRYHRRLLAMPTYALSTTEIPLSKNWLFLGKGFRWKPSHTQKLHQIKQVKNERFMQRGKFYQSVRCFCQTHEQTQLAKWLNSRSRLNPFRPDPPVGGSTFLHGVGEEDKSVYIPQDVRVGHTFVVGTTRVGKTRLASILINQDIRNGDAVIVVDPKGDQDLVRDMKAAAKVSGRSEDFHIVHLGFPEQSAHYNPLKNYHQLSEVATRITDAIAAEGEGKQFAAFAWKYVNIVAICLEEMQQEITYQSIAFYISRLDQLLMTYADTILPDHYPDYDQHIEQIIEEHNSKIGKNNKTKTPMERHQAVIQYVKDHINKTIKNGNTESLHDQILIDLFDAAVMDKNYYDKITASLGPVLSEINKSNASKILSSKSKPKDIELMDIIKNKKILYIGLDSLTNPNIAQSEDFHIVHLGFPEQSAHYNPLKNYHQLSEVATRITDAIAAEGEGKQFAAFAWKYVNIVAICLEEMQQEITYQSIAFYISRLDQLLMTYADTILPDHYPDYDQHIEQIIEEHNSKIGKNNKTKTPMERHQAVIQYVKDHINKTIKNGNTESLHDQILIDLFDAAVMDKNYYDKITASLGPVLSEINKSNASKILSSKSKPKDIELMDIIKNKKILYIGLDSLTNPNIAQAVGKAFLSDLVSTAGKIYKEENAKYTLNLHCDELSEIIQDSFVKILNKAGGAGFQVTAYAQTIQDMEVALGSRAKADVSEGNFNTLIMLRVKNEETANLLAKVLPKVDVIGHTQVSMVNDTPHGEYGVYFNTSNEDRVQTSSVPMIGVEDIVSLPKGQAFILVNGGSLFKIRIPLPIINRR